MSGPLVEHPLTRAEQAAHDSAARLHDDEAGRLPWPKAAPLIFLLSAGAWVIFISAGIGLLVWWWSL